MPPDLGGAALLVERAAINGFTVPVASARTPADQPVPSAGGGCRLIPARDGGWVAINLARPDDRALLPALFCDDTLDPQDDSAIAARMALCDAGDSVARGREMGLALASIDEYPASTGMVVTAIGPRCAPPSGRPPLVVDLSALWAGPLAGHLLWRAGAEVVKVESRSRPDSMRDGDPGLFALVNQGKASVALDLRDPADRAALILLIERADMVIEAARPRALLQLGIDADAIVARAPGLVWLTITGHGAAQTATGSAADWVGFGDDCSVAGGLSDALREATGRIGFGGDALADPISGIVAAHTLWNRWSRGEGARIILSMSAIVRTALDRERLNDPATFSTDLKHWVAAAGHPIAPGPARTPIAPVAPLGRDNALWLGGTR
ncbi:MAG TPA: CoA transferase [Sphingobium sp.]